MTRFEQYMIIYVIIIQQNMIMQGLIKIDPCNIMNTWGKVSIIAPFGHVG